MCDAGPLLDSRSDSRNCDDKGKPTICQPQVPRPYACVQMTGADLGATALCQQLQHICQVACQLCLNNAQERQPLGLPSGLQMIVKCL